MLEALFRTYTNRGFDVVDLHGDGDFACIEDDIDPVTTVTYAQDNHGGEVKRSVRTIKEVTCGLIHGMPFKRLPIELIK